MERIILWNTRTLIYQMECFSNCSIKDIKWSFFFFFIDCLSYFQWYHLHVNNSNKFSLWCSPLIYLAQLWKYYKISYGNSREKNLRLDGVSTIAIPLIETESDDLGSVRVCGCWVLKIHLIYLTKCSHFFQVDH
jgi:hypothetical protein